MTHSLDLITTLALGLGFALVLGFAAVRLGLPAIVGYLIAGIVIGPATPGFVADAELARQLADIGVMLLMFGVGLKFSLGDLLAVHRVALPGALLQMSVGTALGTALALHWGWALAPAVVLGLALSVASTVVALRALESRGALESVNGRITVGWVVVQDLAMVLALVLLPPLAGWAQGGSLLITLASVLGQVTVFIVLMLAVGRRLFPWLLWHVARTGSRELFILCVIAAALGIAYASSEVFGISFALGAFFAGVVMRESELSYRAAAESLPLRDAFSVLFFVSIGVLFDPQAVMREPILVLAALLVVVLGNSVAAALFVLASRYPLSSALVVGISLAQIGEFSFILAGLGMSLGLLTAEGQSLILATALLSVALNPFLLRLASPLERWLRARSALAWAIERSGDPLAELPMSTDQRRLTGQVVLAGYGRVGEHIALALNKGAVPFVVAEQNRDIVERLRKAGVAAVSGDASEPSVLIQAHIARAQMFIIAFPDTFRARKAIEIARMLNPSIGAVVRAPSSEEAELLRRDQGAEAFVGEHELASSISRHVLQRMRG